MGFACGDIGRMTGGGSVIVVIWEYTESSVVVVSDGVVYVYITRIITATGLAYPLGGGVYYLCVSYLHGC